MKALCLLWSLATMFVVGLVFAGIGAFFFLATESRVETAIPEAGIPEGSTPCYWVSSSGVDEKSQFVIDAALRENKLDVVSVEVSAYGEDYVCPQPDGSETREFSAMGISPTITLAVAEADVEDTEALGTLIGQTIEAMSVLPLPGVDQLTINFQGSNTNAARLTWVAPYNEVLAYWTAGITGSELYDQGKILE